MKQILVMLLGAAMLRPQPRRVRMRIEIKIGVGVIGPISPQTEADIEQIVGALPNVKVVPIVPPGDVDACVKRFVAGDTDDQARRGDGREPADRVVPDVKHLERGHLHRRL